MLKINKKAFSFTELLITVSIITILGVIAYSSYSSFQDKANNQKVTSDLKALNAAFLTYINVENKLPDPLGNKNYFDKDSAYSHSSSGAFGVYGQVTKNVLNSKYIDFVPRDPRVNIYYSYGKTLGKNEFEVSGVIKEDDVFKSLVFGNYKSETGPINLIREYNGPEFVYNNSEENYPYNPEERILIAKIRKITGTIKINGKTYNNLANIEKLDLLEGTKIETNPNSSAEIYFSDGTVSVLEGNSELTLGDMKYKEDNSLFTKVKIILSAGKVWTKATRLANESEFEIYTDDAIIAVRGTIFGVDNSSSNTKVKLVEGKIEVKNSSSTQTLSGTLLETTATATSVSAPISITLSSEEEKLLNNFSKITNNNRVELVSYSRYGDTFEIKLKDISFADKIVFSTGTIAEFNLNDTTKKFRQGNFIILNEKNLNWTSGNLKIKLKKGNSETDWLEIKNIDKVDYSIEGSDMTSYEPFWENTLGDLSFLDEGETVKIINFTGGVISSFWEKHREGRVDSFGINNITFYGSNDEDRGGTYKYISVPNIEYDVNGNIDYKISLTLSGSNSSSNGDISYELLFGNSDSRLIYTSNPKEYYNNDDGGYVDESNADIYFDLNTKKWKQGILDYTGGRRYKLDTSSIPMTFINTTGWGDYIYVFNKPKITKNGTKIEFYLKKEFGYYDSEARKNHINEVLSNLTDVRFYINRTFNGINDNTKVTITDFKIEKQKPLDFQLKAYAPYNKVNDYTLYKEDVSFYADTTESGALEGLELVPNITDTCDSNFLFSGSSFCQIGDVKGFYIDNLNNTTDPDFLTYEFSGDEILDSRSGFAIEINVRGEDLMRSDGTYYLFDSDAGVNKSFYLKKDLNDLYLKSKNLITNKTKIINRKINSLEKNKFYRIIAGVKNNKMFLIIPALNYKYIEEYNGGDINTLYIGVNYDSPSYKQQWNSIIDYIKIYK